MLPVSVSTAPAARRLRIRPLTTGAGILAVLGLSLFIAPGCRNGDEKAADHADPFAASLQIEAAASDRRALEQARLHLAASTAENERKDRELARLRDRCENLQRTVDATQARISDRNPYSARLPRQLRRNLAAIASVYGDWVRFDAEEGALVLQSDFTFVAGQATLTPDATAALRELAAALTEPASRPIDILVAAHTDRKPIPFDEPAHRRERLTSAEHAISVVEGLVASGIPIETLAIAAWGGARPITGNDDPTGRFTNRRIEMRLTLRPHEPSTTASVDATEVSVE